MSKNKIKIIEKLDFEKALLNLEEIVDKMGSNQIGLEEMVDLYEKGIALLAHCSSKLEDAKMKVEFLLK